MERLKKNFSDLKKSVKDAWSSPPFSAEDMRRYRFQTDLSIELMDEGEGFEEPDSDDDYVWELDIYEYQYLELYPLDDILFWHTMNNNNDIKFFFKRELTEDIFNNLIKKYFPRPCMIHTHTLNIYDCVSLKEICRWGDNGHVTHGQPFPEELKPCCISCSSRDTKWEMVPGDYDSDDSDEIKEYAWYCKSCLSVAKEEFYDW